MRFLVFILTLFALVPAAEARKPAQKIVPVAKAVPTLGAMEGSRGEVFRLKLLR